VKVELIGFTVSVDVEHERERLGQSRVTPGLLAQASGQSCPFLKRRLQEQEAKKCSG
jgi:hypothetical protein